MGRHQPRDEYLASLPKEHGIGARYRAGCRCDECRAFASAERKRRRHVDIEATRASDRAYRQRRRTDAA